MIHTDDRPSSARTIGSPAVILLADADCTRGLVDGVHIWADQCLKPFLEQPRVPERAASIPQLLGSTWRDHHAHLDGSVVRIDCGDDGLLPSVRGSPPILLGADMRGTGRPMNALHIEAYPRLHVLLRKDPWRRLRRLPLLPLQPLAHHTHVLGVVAGMLPSSSIDSTRDVVFSALLRILEDLVRIPHSRKGVLGVLAVSVCGGISTVGKHLVWVGFKCSLPEGLLDVIIGRISAEAKCLVRVLRVNGR